MKSFAQFVSLFIALHTAAQAGVFVEEDTLGKNLGGWNKRGDKVAEYSLSGAKYRTYRPEITPTPDGGIFISLRIDHVRGWLSSDDHAMLEITADREGRVVSAQSSVAIQGRSVSSDVIRGATGVGQRIAGMDRAVQIGADLIADVSAKMLREKIVEAGRVSFPSALRHNYNLLYQSIRNEKELATKAPIPVGFPVNEHRQSELPNAKHLEINPYGAAGKTE